MVFGEVWCMWGVNLISFVGVRSVALISVFPVDRLKKEDAHCYFKEKGIKFDRERWVEINRDEHI
jgi:hypothetical protein